MITRKILGYGSLFAVITVLAFAVLSLTGCKQPTDSPPDKTLVGITLNTATVKKSYTQNETLNLSGLVVTANYSDSTSAAVTNYTANPTDGATLATIGNDIKVTISYAEGGVTKTADFSVTVADPIPDITDTTAPALSAGSVNRTGDTQATIGFTTDEAGTAYYLVVEKDATAPTNTAVKAGTSLGAVSGAVSGKAVTLTAGAKDIYVVVQDAAGNISAPLKIAAAAYVPSSGGGESSAGITISVKQIEDEASVFPDITISRTGSNKTSTVTVENASAYSGIAWEVAGVGAGQTVTGSGASFTLNAANVNYNSLGGHALILVVTKGEGADAVQYIRAIPFTVVQ